MDRDSRCSCSSKSRCIWILLLLVLFLQPALASAGEIPSPTSAQAGFVSSPLLAWNLDTVFSPVNSLLGSRRRMIQFATIGMCIGLYILMRK
jgi:hypothetical protein